MFLFKNNSKLLFFSLMAVFATLPLPMIINNIAIIIFLLFSLLNLRNLKVKLNPLYLFFPIIFVLTSLSLIYNCSFEMGIKSQEKILGFLLFYLFIPSVNLSKDQVKSIVKTFANICLALLMWCFIVAIFLSLSNQSFIVFNPENLVNENYFYYHRFSSAIGIHAVYFSVFLAFSTLINLHFFKKLGYKHNLFFALKIGVLILGIFLLQSFAVLFSFAIIIGSYLLIFNKKLFSKKTKLLVLGAAIIFPTLIFYNKANVDSKVIFEYNLSDDIHNKNWNSLNVRLAKWECAIDASIKNLPLGVGSGCTKTELKEVYLEKTFLLGYDKGFDTHNQYLHYFLELGVVGIVIFISFLIISLYHSFKTNNILLFSLLVLLIVTGVTENLLYNNKGIVFFSSFFYLLINNYEK